MKERLPAEHQFGLIPKVELHMHLEGAAPPDFVRQLAHEKNMDLTGVFDAQGNYAFDNFVHFLRVYEAATETLKTPEDYHRLTRAVLTESAANGVVYSETFLSPDFCGGGDVGAWREYLAAIKEAGDAAERADGIVLRGIVTAVRHFGPEKGRAAALCAAETAGDWLVGFGLAGDESYGVPQDHAYSFDMAKESGLRLTAHAGEWGGPQSVRDALTLGIERVGHGVQAAQDPALVELLAETGIVLEICPGSNIALDVYQSWGDHPIKLLADRGVKVTISTDDPPFFGSTMNYEYDRLADTFGWGIDEFTRMNDTAARAAFCDEKTRADILQKLEAEA